MTKWLNRFSILFGITSLILFLVVIYNPIQHINSISYLSLSVVIAYTFFTATIFITNSNLSLIVSGLVLLICALPLFIHLIGWIEPDHLEKSWPLLLSMIIFQTGIAMLSLMQLFKLNVPKNLLTITSAIIITVIFLIIMVIILLQVADDYVFKYVFPSLFVVALFFTLSLIFQTKQQDG